MHDEIHQCVVCLFGKHFCELASVVGFLQRVAAHCNIATSGRAFQNQTCDGPSVSIVCLFAYLFVFISGTMRFSRYGQGASYLATHNHSAIPEVTPKSSNYLTPRGTQASVLRSGTVRCTACTSREVCEQHQEEIFIDGQLWAANEQRREARYSLIRFDEQRVRLLVRPSEVEVRKCQKGMMINSIARGRVGTEASIRSCIIAWHLFIKRDC